MDVKSYLPALYEPNEKALETERTYSRLESSFTDSIESGETCAKIAHALKSDWKIKPFEITDDEIWRRANGYAVGQLNLTLDAFNKYMRLTKGMKVERPELVHIHQRLIRGSALCQRCLAKMQMAETGVCPMAAILREGPKRED